MGESRNTTCDAIENLGSTSIFDDIPDVWADDPQEITASDPEPSPTRGQTLLCLAGLLGVFWFIATQWLPQQGVSLASVSFFILCFIFTGKLIAFVR